MLVSNPIKQIGGDNIINIIVSNYGYNINNDTLSLDDIMTLYFVSINMIDPINNKYNDYTNKFFNNGEFIFLNTIGNQIDNITNQITLLNNINELTIKSYINKYPNISIIAVINFYIKFITELTKILRTLDKNIVIYQLYTLSLKDNELLNLLNKENNIIIKNIQACYSQILKTLNKENLENDLKNELNDNIKINQDIINNNINNNNNNINNNNNNINNNNINNNNINNNNINNNNINNNNINNNNINNNIQ